MTPFVGHYIFGQLLNAVDLPLSNSFSTLGRAGAPWAKLPSDARLPFAHLMVVMIVVMVILMMVIVVNVDDQIW